MTQLVFPYSVPYPRTGKWWGDDWRVISNWMTECIGPCTTDWEYMSEEFYFKTAEDKTLFLLRWK